MVEIFVYHVATTTYLYSQTGNQLKDVLAMFWAMFGAMFGVGRCLEQWLRQSHFLYRFSDGKKTTHSQFSVPGLWEIHRNLKKEKKLILASPFLENPLFVLFPA